MNGVNLRLASLKGASMKLCGLRFADMAGTDLEVCYGCVYVYNNCIACKDGDHNGSCSKRRDTFEEHVTVVD